MRTSLLTMALAAASLFTSQVALARSVDVEALGAPLQVFQLDDAAAERARFAEHSGGERAVDGEDDAPPPLGAPQDELEDGFQRYFDHHSRVHAAWDAAESTSRALD